MFKKKPEESAIIQFHPDTHKPILKCSICTGEQVAGFKDINTGTFNENGYEYVSEKENAETNNVSIRVINKIISDGLGIKVYKIQIDTDSGKVTIIMK